MASEVTENPSVDPKAGGMVMTNSREDGEKNNMDCETSDKLETSDGKLSCVVGDGSQQDNQNNYAENAVEDKTSSVDNADVNKSGDEATEVESNQSDKCQADISNSVSETIVTENINLHMNDYIRSCVKSCDDGTKKGGLLDNVEVTQADQQGDVSNEIALKICDIRSMGNNVSVVKNDINKDVLLGENKCNTLSVNESDCDNVGSKTSDEIQKKHRDLSVGCDTASARKVSEPSSETDCRSAESSPSQLLTQLVNSEEEKSAGDISSQNASTSGTEEQVGTSETGSEKVEESLEMPLMFITDVRSLSEEKDGPAAGSSDGQRVSNADSAEPGTPQSVTDSSSNHSNSGNDSRELANKNVESHEREEAKRMIESENNVEKAQNISSAIASSSSVEKSQDTNIEHDLPVIVPESVQTVERLNFQLQSSSEPTNNVGATTEPGAASSTSVSTSLPLVAQSGKSASSPAQSSSVSTGQADMASTVDSSLPVISNIFSIKQEVDDSAEYGVYTGSSVGTAANQGQANRGGLSTVIDKLYGNSTVKTVDCLKSGTSNLKPGNNTVITKSQVQIVSSGTFLNHGKPIQIIRAKSQVSIPQNKVVQKVVVSAPGAYRVVGGSKSKTVELVCPKESLTTGKKTLVKVGNSFQPCQKTSVIQSSSKKPVKVIQPFAKQSEDVIPSNVTIVHPLIPVKPKRIQPSAPSPSTHAATSPRSGLTAARAVASDRGTKPTEPKSRDTKDNSNFINIQTVGVASITELISRRNPLPMFKPPPVPDHLKDAGKNRKVFQCYECGDTFNFERSLKIHLNRCSMRLNYKCTKCDCQIEFTNKCQLLGHLRSHLNLKHTQAVPLHIKSDSINIKTVFEEIGEGKKFQWYNEKPVIQVHEQLCPICCSKFSSPDQLREHYSRSSPNMLHKCDLCSIYLPNKCSWVLHKKLHTFAEDNTSLDSLDCPECGKTFKTSEANSLGTHLEVQCFHSSRVWNVSCPKCGFHCDSKEGLRQHLIDNMESYFKCLECPIALKVVQNFNQHYTTKHTLLVKEKDVTERAKMIYRCHICDTLIDDRQFLMSHLTTHLHNIFAKGRFEFVCKLCKRRVYSAEGMKVHYKLHSNVRILLKSCNTCKKYFDNAVAVFVHRLMFHKERTARLDVIFCECGLVCTSKAALDAHDCIMKTRNLDGQGCPQESGLRRKNEPAVSQKEKKESLKTAAKVKKKRDNTNCTADSEEEEEEDNFDKVRLTLKGVEGEKKYVDKGETFQCDKCSESFTRRSKLEDHKEAEHGIHSCHLCGLLYESQKKLMLHLYVHHKGVKPVYYCWICRARKVEKYCTDKATLERHLRQKHRLKTWDRSKIVAEWPDLEMKGVSPEPQLIQSIKDGSGSEEEPPMKKLKVEGEVIFKCAKCVFTCESRADFLEHISGHHTANTVQCLECGLCFTVMPSLQRHLFMVHKLRDFDGYVKENGIEAPKEMENLDFIEREESPLPPQSEESSSEEDTANQCECKVCYREFDSEHALKQHMRVHGMAFIKKSRRRRANKLKAGNGIRGSEEDKGDKVEESLLQAKRPKVESDIAAADVDSTPQHAIEESNHVETLTS